MNSGPSQGIAAVFCMGTAEVFNVEDDSTGSWLEHMPEACPREYFFSAEYNKNITGKRT